MMTFVFAFLTVVGCLYALICIERAQRMQTNMSFAGKVLAASAEITDAMIKLLLA